MNIGWDAKRAFLNGTGLGVYSRTIIHSISTLSPQSRFVLFTPKFSTKFFTAPENNTVLYPKGWFGSMFHSLWRSFGISRSKTMKELDIYHGLSGEIPFFLPKHLTVFVTIHDVLFERFPKDYPLLDRFFYRWKAKYAVKRSDYILAVSEATRQDLISYYKVPESKIIVIPNTISIPSQSIQLPTTKLFGKPFVFFISTFIARKNQLLLVNAFDKIAEQLDFDLILIGSGRAYYKTVTSAVSQLKNQHRIHFVPKINEQELIWYYRNALFSVYPSLYEGFGIPIMESIYHYCPVLVSDIKPFRDLAGDLAFYFKNNDVEDLAESMLKLSKHMNVLSPEYITDRKKFVIDYSSEYQHKKLLELYTNSLLNKQ